MGAPSVAHLGYSLLSRLHLSLHSKWQKRKAIIINLNGKERDKLGKKGMRKKRKDRRSKKAKKHESCMTVLIP